MRQVLLDLKMFSMLVLGVSFCFNATLNTKPVLVVAGAPKVLNPKHIWSFGVGSQGAVVSLGLPVLRKP